MSDCPGTRCGLHGHPLCSPQAPRAARVSVLHVSPRLAGCRRTLVNQSPAHTHLCLLYWKEKTGRPCCLGLGVCCHWLRPHRSPPPTHTQLSSRAALLRKAPREKGGDRHWQPALHTAWGGGLWHRECDGHYRGHVPGGLGGLVPREPTGGSDFPKAFPASESSRATTSKIPHIANAPMQELLTGSQCKRII